MTHENNDSLCTSNQAEEGGDFGGETREAHKNIFLDLEPHSLVSTHEKSLAHMFRHRENSGERVPGVFSLLPHY